MKKFYFLFFVCLLFCVNAAMADTKTKSWNLTSSSTDWTASGHETYFKQPYGFKKANGTLTNKSIADFYTAGITEIKVGFKCLQNGDNTSRLTIYLVDKDGKAIGSGVEVTPVNASSASNTTYQYATFTDNLEGATGFMMKVTTFGKNILVNGAEYTVTYDPNASSEVAPTIIEQPVSASYEQNATANALTITASGNPAPTYQWYSNTENSNTNGTVLEGETGTSFTPATTEVGTKYYYCVATNPVGSATSDVAAVTVKEPFAGTIVTMSSANDADIKFVKGSNNAAGAVWANSTPLTAKGITLSGDKGSNTVCSYYDGTVVRFYDGNSLIITPKDGITIEKIEIVRKSTTGDNNGTINCTGLTASGENTKTNTNVYTGSATSAVTFTAAAQARFTEIKVYYTGGAAAYVEAPTLTVPEGTYFEAQTVKVNNYDSNLKYYYTTDAEEPTWDPSFQPTGTTQAYNDKTGINISETTTLKILATDGSNRSSVVTAVYTITTPDATDIMALRQLGPGTYNVSLTDAIVTYVNGKNAYIQDATGGLLIYTSHSLEAGEKVNGRVVVKLIDYYGTDEATTFDVSGATITSGNDIPVTELTIADLLTGNGMKTYESMRVKIADAIVTAAITDRTGTIVKGENEITIYEGTLNCLSTTCMTDVNAIANVIGYPTTYNNKDVQLKQLKLWNASAVEETGYNLSVSAAGYATYFNSTKAYKLPASCVGYVWEDGKIVGVYKEKDNVVPANEPLVIQAAAGSYPLMFTTTSIPSDTYKSYGMNALEGTDEATAITPDPDYYFYGLSLNSSNDINSVGFYWMEADGAAFTNGAHKAYLKIPTRKFEGAQPVRGFAFKGTTTGVESVESSNNAPQAIYDLTGRRVSKAEKGIYIINGKKVIK